MGVGVLCVLVTLTVLFPLLDVHTVTILSDSMVPTFHAGDAILTHPSSVHVGDVITYTNAEGVSIAHRVVDLGSLVTTRGDANGANDVSFSYDHITGVMFGPRLPFMGYVLIHKTAVIVGAMCMALLPIIFSTKQGKQDDVD
nr:signal peptidase I [Actinomyces vulturis]